jgi:hypothetical protein
MLCCGMTTPIDSSPMVQQIVSKVVGTVAQKRGNAIRSKVAEARAKFPDLTNEQLAKRFIRNRSFYSGVSGGVTSLGGLMTLPVTLPASVASSLAFQAEIVLTVAHIYGHDLNSEDRYLDFLLVFMGNNVHEVLKRLGIAAGTRLTRRVVDRLFTRQVMYQIWKIVGKNVLTKAGTKSTFSLMRIVPLVAAPIGFAFDYAAARAIGKAALSYYGHDGLESDPEDLDEIDAADGAASPVPA